MTQLPLELRSVKLSPQCQTILEMLRRAQQRGVSGVEFVHEAHIFAYSQRAGELRKAGHEIVSRRDGSSPVYRYWLAQYAPKDVAA